MKVKIIFLMTLLVGLNSLARSINNNVSSICDEISEINDYTDEGFGNNCGGNWSGIIFAKTETTSSTITINWNHTKAEPEPTYIVTYTKLWEEAWSQEIHIGSATSYTFKHLTPDTDYTLKVIRNCGGEKKESQADESTVIKDDDGDTPDNDGSTGSIIVDCNTPTELSVGNITPTSAEVKFEKFNTSSNLEYEWTFFRKHKGKRADSHTHEPNAYNASPSWQRPPYPQTKTLNGLSPNTDYHFWIVKRCATYGGLKRIVFSESIDFRTPENIGSCGCTNGNTTIRDAFNGEYTKFYCGTITAVGVISEATSNLPHGNAGGSGSGNSGGGIGQVGSTKPPLGKTIFKGSVVELNPGFETKISGSGSFVAVAFNPNTCQESAAAPQQGQASMSAAKMSAPNNSSSSARVLVPKKYIVYPNPNRGSFSIDFKEKDVIIRSITVYDMFGVRILHRRYNRRLDVEQYSLRLAKSGLYKIAIRTASGVEYETLLIEF